MLDAIEKETQQVVATFITLLPDVVGAVLLVLTGWVVGTLLRLAVGRLTRSLNRFLSSHLVTGRWAFVRIPVSAQTLLGQIVFWISMLVFVAIAVRLLGFTSAAGWLDRLVVYIPSLLAGGLIIVAGFILGAMARRLVTHAAAAADVSQPHWFGQIVQASFVVVGLVIGLGQIGVDVTFVILLLGISLGAVLMGFALAFGLGARTLVENLIALQHVKQLAHPGQLIQVGNVQGRLLEFTTTSLVVETAQGRTAIPAKSCLQEHFTLLTESDVASSQQGDST